MLSCGESLAPKTGQSRSVLSDVLSEAGQIEIRLGQAVVEWEVRVEDKVIRPLTTLLETDLPALFKSKRTLVKLSEGMDVARAKHTNATRLSQSSDKTASAIRDAKEEWEDAVAKVEHAKVSHLVGNIILRTLSKAKLSYFVCFFFLGPVHNGSLPIIGQRG